MCSKCVCVLLTWQLTLIRTLVKISFSRVSLCPLSSPCPYMDQLRAHGNSHVWTHVNCQVMFTLLGGTRQRLYGGGRRQTSWAEMEKHEHSWRCRSLPWLRKVTRTQKDWCHCGDHWGVNTEEEWDGATQGTIVCVCAHACACVSEIETKTRVGEVEQSIALVKNVGHT